MSFSGAETQQARKVWFRSSEASNSIIGVDGLQQILQQIPADSPVKTVCIGGINASNVSRVVWQSGDPSGRGRSLDGVAVVAERVAVGME